MHIHNNFYHIYILYRFKHDFYCEYIRIIALRAIELTQQNYIFIFLEVLIILYSIYIYLKNKNSYKSIIQKYTYSDSQKYKIWIFIIIPILFLNFGFINIEATENAVELINGNIGYRIDLIPNDNTTIEIPNKLMFVLLKDENFFVVERANYSNANLYIVPSNKIKFAIIHNNDSRNSKNNTICLENESMQNECILIDNCQKDISQNGSLQNNNLFAKIYHISPMICQLLVAIVFYLLIYLYPHQFQKRIRSNYKKSKVYISSKWMKNRTNKEI